MAEDRLRYVFSFLTAVDAVTIIPAFVLYGMGAVVNETVPGLNFLRVLRCVVVLSRSAARCPAGWRAWRDGARLCKGWQQLTATDVRSTP